MPSSLLRYVYMSPIMIVDDNELNRIFLIKILGSRGFNNILAFANAEDALEQLSNFNPDLVILDLIMPKMDGFECCQVIRSQPIFRDLPILIQTTITEPELRVKAFACGATDFISKPVYPDELCARVIVHLQNRIYLKNLRLYKIRIEEELEAARQLQISILPSKEEIAEIENRCNLSIASHFQPSSEIGGDVFGIKPLFAQQFALWLADFSGHGVASTLNAFRLQAYLKENSQFDTRPGEYLAYLNEKLLQLSLNNQFATMFYGIVDIQSDKLIYSAACNPHPIILRANGEIDIIDGSGRPLGIGMNFYETITVPFFIGDSLILYSDALIETEKFSGGYIDGSELANLVARNKNESAENIKNSILNYFTEKCSAPIDDLTIYICVRTANKTI